MKLFWRVLCRLGTLIRDYHRGYTDSDIRSAARKIHAEHVPTPGGIIKVTKGELKAIIGEDMQL